MKCLDEAKGCLDDIGFVGALSCVGARVEGSEVIALFPTNTPSERLACSKVVGHFKVEDFVEALGSHIYDCGNCRNRYVDYLVGVSKITKERLFDLDKRYLNLLERED